MSSTNRWSTWAQYNLVATLYINPTVLCFLFDLQAKKFRLRLHLLHLHDG